MLALPVITIFLIIAIKSYCIIGQCNNMNLEALKKYKNLRTPPLFLAMKFIVILILMPLTVTTLPLLISSDFTNLQKLLFSTSEMIVFTAHYTQVIRFFPAMILVFINVLFGSELIYFQIPYFRKHYYNYILLAKLRSTPDKLNSDEDTLRKICQKEHVTFKKILLWTNGICLIALIISLLSYQRYETSGLKIGRVIMKDTFHTWESIEYAKLSIELEPDEGELCAYGQFLIAFTNTDTTDYWDAPGWGTLKCDEIVKIVNAIRLKSKRLVINSLPKDIEKNWGNRTKGAIKNMKCVFTTLLENQN